MAGAEPVEEVQERHPGAQRGDLGDRGQVVRLEVVEANFPARRLYSRCGFAVVGPNPEDAAEIVMEHVPDR